MKKLLIASTMFLAAAGCQMSDPQTAQDARNQAIGNSFVGISATEPVRRSVTAVNASIREGAARCFNRTVANRSLGTGSGGPQIGSYQTRYSSQFRGNARAGELTVRRQLPSQVVQLGPKNGVIMVVDTQVSNYGTNVTIHGSRFGTGKMTDAVLSWAKGGPIRCPSLT